MKSVHHAVGAFYSEISTKPEISRGREAIRNGLFCGCFKKVALEQVDGDGNKVPVRLLLGYPVAGAFDRFFVIKTPEKIEFLIDGEVQVQIPSFTLDTMLSVVVDQAEFAVRELWERLQPFLLDKSCDSYEKRLKEDVNRLIYKLYL